MQNDSIEHQGIELNHQQLLMWTGQQLEPNRPIYNMGFQIEIPIAIDKTAFARAFEWIVSQSKSHRSVIEMQQGVPRIQLKEEIPFELELLDLSDTDDPEKLAHQWCQRRCERMFDLSERLFDSALLRVAPEKYIWFTNHHHLISDAWSSTQLLRLQALAYEAFVDGRNPGELQCELEHNDSAMLETPIDSSERHIVFYGRDPQRNSSDSIRIEVLSESDEQHRQLEQIINCGDAKSFSPELGKFNVMMTLLLALLNRVSGRRDLCVGVPFHNRLTTEQKKSLGLFISLHPYSVLLEPGETFRTLFDKVRIASTDYLKTAANGQQAGPNSDYNVIFNFINAEFGEFAGTGVRAQWLHAGCHDRQHNLRMHVEGFDEQMAIKCDLNLDVFGDKQQAEIKRHFRALIDAFASDWDRQLEQVELATAEEISARLESLQKAGVSSDLIPSLFGKAVEQCPDQTAIEFDGQKLTYDQFNQMVDQIAHQLTAEFDGFGNRLAISLNRSPEAVAAMMAAMKTGNTLVPLDPAWPAARQQHIVDDADAVCIITTSQYELPQNLEHLRIDIDKLSESATDFDMPEISGGDSAYVLYTSGSTGNPKGVEISHASIAHYVNWAVSFYGQGSPISFPLFTPLTFDLTLTSIFVPLLSGGRIVVYGERQGGHDTSLLQVLDDDLVDIIKLTPSHLSLLVGQDYQSSRVKQLILGGEDLSSDLARQTFSVFPPDLKIHNEYGPTEATVGCVVHAINSKDDSHSVSVPIGMPIPGTAALVVNDSMRVQPDGVAGELCILGAGLARGYLNQNELTSNKFVSLDAAGGRRAYRTGDVARWNECGQLEYLGRFDDQVKIRGARIELKSVEAALREHTAIADVVVTSYQPRAANESIDNCSRCGLASNFPGTQFDSDGVCDQCRSFEGYRENANAYFRSMAELKSTLATKNSGEFDCIALLSGGKDSSYMLARLVDLDLRVLAFTLDNGYISEEAKANIRRVTETLGVEHVFGTTPHMNKIFVDSLKRFSNVCQGCFKTIYTLAMNLALEKQIPFIVTGLSRGQFFETRLTEELFWEPCDNLVQIDQSVLDARKAYHRIPDSVFEHLDVAALQQDETFEKVQFVDFYRYCDVTLEEMLDYLNHKLPWIRPADTGRSTNCLINDVGIYVHKRNEGFHNYTMPYSWDVRMGHKTRDEAVEELVDRIDVSSVHRILNEIGYDGELASQDRSARLIAYFTSDESVTREELGEFLKQRLPEFMLPSKYVQIESVPLTANGKVDTSRLPDPFTTSIVKQDNYEPPENELQAKLTEIWQKMLGVDKVGILDNFFDLGGDSIVAIQIVASANQGGIRIKPSDMFESLTVKKLAARIDDSQIVYDFDLNAEQQYLSPAQCWMLQHGLGADDYWTQSVELRLPPELQESDLNRLGEALSKIVRANPALRTLIRSAEDIELVDPESAIELEVADLRGSLNGQLEENLASIESGLTQKLTMSSDKLLAGAVIRYPENDYRLLLMANHLAVDAVSWQKIIAELCRFFESLDPVNWQPEEQVPFAVWTELLNSKAQTDFVQQLEYWQSSLKVPAVFESANLTNTKRVNSGFGRLSRQLSRVETEQVENQIKASRLRLHEMLLAAFAKTVAEYSGTQDFRIFVEGHGRADLDPDVDYSRTVGWFTSIYPVRFSVPDVSGVEFANAVKDQLRAVPDGGIGFGALKYLNDDTAVRDSLITRSNEVVFNFLGKATHQEDARVSVSRALKLHRSDSMSRSTILDFNLLFDSVLNIDVEYAKSRFDSRDVSAIMDEFVNNLLAMAEGLSKNQAATASDFPLAKLDSRQLGDLAAALKRANKQG